MRTYLSILLITLPMCSIANSVQSETMTIKEVMTGYSHKGIFINFNSPIPNPANCPSSQNIVAVTTENSDVNQVLAVALSSHMSNSLVDIQVYNNTCFEGWPVLRRIKIKK